MRKILVVVLLVLLLPMAGFAAGESQKQPTTANANKTTTNEGAVNHTESTLPQKELSTPADTQIEVDKKPLNSVPTTSPADNLSKAEANTAETTAAKASERSEPAAGNRMTVEWGNQVPSSNATSFYIGGKSIPSAPTKRRSSIRTRGSDKVPTHPIQWKTNTEWLSVGGVISSYGSGGILSIATLRWHNVYWEVAKANVGAWKRTIHAFGTTMIGMPFWISARHEIRTGVGISAGYLRSRKPVQSDDKDFAGSGIYAASLKTYMMLPLEVSYVYHHLEHLAFQGAVMVAFPMNYKVTYSSSQPINGDDYDADYRPYVSVQGALRF